jgi:hypothetical protein
MKRHWLATGLLLTILVVGNCWAKYRENPDAVFKALHADDSTINQAVIDELKLDLMVNGQYAEGLRWERAVPANTKVLAIDVESSTKYLFWRREGKGWKYLGSRYYLSQIRGQPILKTITTPDNRSFLRIIYYQDEGTGIYRQGEDWFDLSGDKLKKILTFSTHGELDILSNYYEVKFSRSSLKLNEGDLHLALHYEGHYRLYYEEKEYPEIEFSRDLFYVLPKGKSKFVLDKKLNKWKKSQIRDMYDPYIGDFITLFPEEMKELKKKNDPKINITIEVIERWKED